MKILDEIAKCERKDLHPTNHPKDCICDHCWEEEMALRFLYERKLTTKVVWKRRKAKAKDPNPEGLEPFAPVS